MPKLSLRLAILLGVITTAALAESHAPDAGNLVQHSFTPQFDAICGIGATMAAGCDAIRGREIVDAAAAPWRAIGRVNFAGYQTRQHCTGTLVADRVVLTAAHCLYDRARKIWIAPADITFVAGFQRGAAVAISNGERFILNDAEDTASRDFRATPAQDWALVVLADPIGRDVGFLPLTRIEGNTPALALAGYAGLRPNVLSVASDCGHPIETTADVILLRCAAMQGDSGAPLLVKTDDTYAVAGVFSAIVGTDQGALSLSIPTAQFHADWAKATMR